MLVAYSPVLALSITQSLEKRVALSLALRDTESARSGLVSTVERTKFGICQILNECKAIMSYLVMFECCWEPMNAVDKGR